MKYFLDFDRTLFDVETLYLELEKTKQRHLAGTQASFQCVSFPELVFSDVADFLRTKNLEDIFIVSSTLGLSAQWDEQYQRQKITEAGMDTKVNKVFVLSGDKTKIIKEAIGQFPESEQVIFIDDRIEHCLSVKQALPDSYCFLITRGESAGESDGYLQGIPVVHTLAEVDDRIKAL